jgi:hypothetical protein
MQRVRGSLEVYVVITGALRATRVNLNTLIFKERGKREEGNYSLFPLPLLIIYELR